MMAGRRLSGRGLAPDEALRRYLDAVRVELEPDPLFRRRLRGVVLNRFVAAREGNPTTPRLEPSRSMGALGRAVLMASVALALSVGGVMAAADSALPGDLLYPVKRQIEAIRFEVVPSPYHEALEAQLLAERLAELSVLVARGETARAAAHADSIVAGGSGLPSGALRAERRLEVLSALLERLPPAAQEAISRSLERRAPIEPNRGEDRSSEPARGSEGGAGHGGGQPPMPASQPSPSANGPKSVSPAPTRGPDAERTPIQRPRGPKSD